MKGTKLFLQLKSLSKSEIKLLQKAVNSPYFNSNPSVILLFEKLKRQHPNFDDTPKGRRNLYKKMFNKEPFNDGKLRRLFTYLSEVVKKFMLHEALENNTRLQQNVLMEIYENRKINPLFEQVTRELLEQPNDEILPNANWFVERLEILLKKYNSLQHKKYNPKDETLNEAMDCLDQYYLLQKIQLMISQKSREKIMKISPNYGNVALLKNEKVSENALIQLYFQSYQLLTEEANVDFASYEKKLKQVMLKLSKNDSTLLFYNGLNYLIRRSNFGDYTLDTFILSWYKWGLEAGIIVKNNKISAATYSNIIYNACLQKEFTWIAEFEKKYVSYLPIDLQQEEVAYSQSLVLFFQEQFEAVSFHLNNYEFSKRNILRTRNLICRTYFELFLQDWDYHEILDSTLKSYENFIYRNDWIAKDSKAAHLNFIKILKKLIAKVLKNEPANNISNWLAKELQQKQTILAKRWLGCKTNVIKLAKC